MIVFLPYAHQSDFPAPWLLFPNAAVTDTVSQPPPRPGIFFTTNCLQPGVIHLSRSLTHLTAIPTSSHHPPLFLLTPSSVSHPLSSQPKLFLSSSLLSDTSPGTQSAWELDEAHPRGRLHPLEVSPPPIFSDVSMPLGVCSKTAAQRTR